jgi:hypothetical protein
VEDYNIDFALEKIEQENDNFFFLARSITKDFVCEKGLKRLAGDSPGKPLVWRHEHPVIPNYKSTHIYGRVLESNAEEGTILSKYQVYGHTDDHRKIREVIEKRHEIGEPIKISMRFRQYGSDKDPVHFDVIEHSLTPTPACDECKVIDILNESDNMPEEEKKLEEVLKEIQELEAQLTKKDKALEELESKIVTLEKQYEEATKEVETEKSEKEKIADQLLEFKDALNELKSKNSKLENDMKFKEVEPLLNTLIELDGEEMKELYEMKARNSLSDDKAFEKVKVDFAARIKKLEKESAHAVPEDLSTTAGSALMKDEELEESKETTLKRDKKAFANMPKEFFEKRGA